MTVHNPSSRSKLVLVWLAYVGFVIYGSLLPFELRPMPLEKALALFEQTPMLRLGIESRADWIANGVLYVPVGFLTAWLFGLHRGEIDRDSPNILLPGRLLLAALFCVALALTIEFTQLFFPARTVSLNDLLAEVIGSGVGLIAAWLTPAWIQNLLHAHRFDPRKVIWHLVEAFLVAYVVFSLFPYDILVSLDELQKKADGDSWGWWLAGESKLDIQGCFKLVAEVALTLPYGIYLGHRLAHRRISPVLVTVPGILLGGTLELAQFFTASGVSQGISVITRLAGVFGGLFVWQRHHVLSPDRLAFALRKHALPLLAFYVAALLLANGWFSYNWGGTEFATAQLTEVKFQPFYYHYYTTEARALFSLASVCLTYLPIGIMVWANRGAPARALWLAASLAAIVETGKLFLQGTHPDPTNILLAGVSAWIGVQCARRLTETFNRGERVATAALQTPAENEPAQPSTQRIREKERKSLGARSIRSADSAARPNRNSMPALLAMLFILVVCAYRAATFPAFPAFVVLILTVCTAIVWQHPARAFFLIPFALPVFDLAPWSGRFYFDEFDFLILTCLAVGYARVPKPSQPVPRDRALIVCLTFIAISLIISITIPLWPWHTPSPNAFTTYFSPFNALRIGKGALWALACIGLMRRMQSAGLDIIRPWALGMMSGLALTVAVIAWERVTFSSLLDFRADYRVTGPVSAMHVGGAYIECFLAVATPFLLLLILQTQSWMKRTIGLCLLLATTYSLMVTYSRGGYAAFAVAISLFLLFAIARSEQARRRWSLAVLLPILAIGTALPALTGQFAQERLARIAPDLNVRIAHWRSVLDLRTHDLTTTLFGMGLGRLPETLYILGSEKTRTGSYQLRTENGNTFLRLVSGNALNVEQIVSVEPRQRYLLKMNVRSPIPGTITLSLCEKWLLTSFECQWINVTIPSTGENWSPVELPTDTLRFKPSPWYARKPIKLSLHTPSGTARHVDVDSIRLEASDEGNLLRNGNFEGSMDRWFFTSDDHLQWHAKSLPIAVLFDQGWVGLISLLALVALAFKRAFHSAWLGNLNAAAALSALVAFLVVGAFDTLIDTPRFLAFLLICGAMNAIVARAGTPTNMESPS